MAIFWRHCLYDLKCFVVCPLCSMCTVSVIVYVFRLCTYCEENVIHIYSYFELWIIYCSVQYTSCNCTSIRHSSDEWTLNVCVAVLYMLCKGIVQLQSKSMNRFFLNISWKVPPMYNVCFAPFSATCPVLN